jgi:Uma2 family endonuclease
VKWIGYNTNSFWLTLQIGTAKLFGVPDRGKSKMSIEELNIEELNIKLDVPLSEWPVFYKRGLPYIYDDTPFLYRKNGERMAEHVRHSSLAIYLHGLLNNLYREQVCTITFNLFLRTKFMVKRKIKRNGLHVRYRYVDVTPDVSLVKGVQHPDAATYILGKDGPPPNVVFEVGSPGTFKEDLDTKKQLYAGALQAKEYFAYDPSKERLWEGSRLKAWRLVEGHYLEMERDARGWVWSTELESWLVEDEVNLWLYDYEGNKRLTRAEQAEAETQQERLRVAQERFRAEQAEAETQQEKVRAEQERLRAEQAEAETQQERLRAEQAEAETQQERLRAEQEKLKAEQLAARLRELEARLQKLEDE